MDLDKKTICSLIDHTNLQPDATREQIQALCREAVENSFKSVCIHPFYVSLAAGILSNTGVIVCTVVGFPTGASFPAAKVLEAREALKNGAGEIDMVLNIGALKNGDDAYVLNEIREVAQASRPALLKVIIETCLLTDDEKEKACQIAVQGGADFVKTSTGFSRGGAAPADVALMRRVVGQSLGVKAAGGIRDLDTLLTMVRAGANRIGTSAGVKIISELK